MEIFLDRGGETGKIPMQGWILVSLKCFANSRESYETPDHRWFKWFGNHRTGYQWMNDTAISGIPSVLETRTPGLVDVTLRCGMSRCIRPDWLLQSPNPLKIASSEFRTEIPTGDSSKISLSLPAQFSKMSHKKYKKKISKKTENHPSVSAGRFPSFVPRPELEFGLLKSGTLSQWWCWWWWSVWQFITTSAEVTWRMVKK